MSNSSLLFRFFFSRPFIINLVLIVFFGAGVLYGTLLYLDYFTLHGQEITVPDLSDMEVEELEQVITEKELKFVILDSVYQDGAPKGVVLDQDPKPMSKVKKDRTVYVTISSLHPPSVRMPLVMDKSLRQASSILENLGLQIGELIYRPDQCVNCVLAQQVGGFNVSKDTLVPKGTLVDLVLGGGLSDEKILVPLLINLTRKEAIRELKKNFLNIGVETDDGSLFDEEDSTNARIYIQYPPYGVKSWVLMGSSVDVEYTIHENKIDTNIVILDSSYYNVAPDSI